jgi:autotransporter-associated beta strand protein
LLATSALVSAWMVLAAYPALADGGAGGGSGSGAGGTGFTGNSGSPGVTVLSGGGGGGAGGGQGGAGGGPNGGPGGPGGISVASPDGTTGGTGGGPTGGGGGGGGGGFNGNGAGAASIINTSPLLGGSGGNGGVGSSSPGGGSGGGGGAGGYGAIVTGGGASSNSSSITGGAGGNGGGVGTGGAGGNGGDGGVGVQFTVPGATFTNTGTVQGGNGGSRGTGGVNGIPGVGGAGIVGSGLSVINSGSIAGGMANAGTGAQANAITFTGGSNFLNLNPAGTQGTLGGNVGVTGTLTFNQTNAVALPNAITGTGAVIQAGPGMLTLSGANTYTGSTTINAGTTLALSGFGTISNSSIVTANGTFDVSGSSIPFNAITTLAGSGAVALGNNGLVITAGSTEFSGAINGAGGLEIFHGTQTLSGVNTYGNVTQIDSGATLALKGSGSIANSLYVGFNGSGTLDISQTKGGAGVGGLFDPSGAGVVWLGSQTLTITGSSGSFFGGIIRDGGIAGGTGGNLTIAAGAAQQLFGTNTYTGVTTINATGELDLINFGGHDGSIATSRAVINNGIFDISNLAAGTSIMSLSGASAGVVNLGANTLAITNANGTFAGVIQDGGAGGGLTIAGGKEILTGANTYSGATLITGGTLEVDGSITGTSSMTVNAGGTLSGTGLVDPPTTTIGGTLAPGSASNPTGALTLAGNLVFQSAATYLVTVGGANASNTQVGGSATLGGTVQASFVSGAAVKTYDILHSAGLGGTTFSGATSLNPNYAVSLSYTPTDVLLNLTAQLGGGGGLNPNQQGVANVINTAFNNGATVPAAIGNVFGLSGGALAAALTQLDGEAATGAERAAFQLTNEFLALMLDPFVNGRGNVGGGAAGGPALGFAPDQQTNLPPDVALAYASILTKAPPQNFDQRWTAWGSAFGGANRTNGDPAVGSNNTTAATYGFAGGMDYHFTPYTVAGFALAGAGTNWGLANALGSGRSDALQVGAYGISWFGPAYVAGALSFSNHWFTIGRSALGDQLNANFIGQSYGARLESGYRVAALPTFAVTPYGAVQFQDFSTPAFSETDVTGGGLGLNFNAMNATDVRTELGSRFDAPTLVYGKPLVLYGRVAWAHDFVSNPALSAAFQALPGGGFTVNGAPIPHDSALTTAGAQLYLTPQWTLLAKFDGEFANGSQTYGGSGTLRYAW